MEGAERAQAEESCIAQKASARGDGSPPRRAIHELRGAGFPSHGRLKRERSLVLDG